MGKNRDAGVVTPVDPPRPFGTRTNMKRLLLATLVTLVAFGLMGCSGSSSKQGTVVSVPVSFSLNDMMSGSVNEPVFGNTVTVKTDDGKEVTAEWDEKLLGKPVSLDLQDTVVVIEPTDDPKVWKVTKIVSKP
jgi:translation initiation factor IF-1